MKRSAGLLLYRVREFALEVLLVHPGGPFWARKDLGAWSIPKGEYLEDEDPLAAAKREFEEEIGANPPAGTPIPLGSIVQSGRKIVTVFALEGDLDVARIVSNTVRIEWPPRSGVFRDWPEVDRAGWFDPLQARGKILAGQSPFLDRLTELPALASRLCISPSSG